MSCFWDLLYRKGSFSNNHLNLPTEILFLRDSKLDYYYDAADNKLRQDVIYAKNLTKRTDFISNFVMENNAPAWINFDEGRVIMDGTNVYFTETHLKDHLGNARVTFTYRGNALEVRQVNSYYPFGMSIKGLSSLNFIAESQSPNEYLYNGKMFQDELGLRWYDYGARMYMPDLGSWTTQDPLAKTYSSWSPYHYVMNNPIRFTDVFGMGAGDFYDENGKYLGTDGNDDGKLYVVTDKQEKKEIKNSNKAGGTSQVSDVKSATELPSAYVRSEMGKAVGRSGSPSFHEEGGFFGTTEEGGEYVVHAEPGETADPSVDKEASINVFNAANKDDLTAAVGGTIDGTFHTHPDGTVTSGATGTNTIGGTTTTYSFNNEPSNLNGRGDIPNAQENRMGVTGSYYVLAQGNKTVYVYNGGGTVATFPFKQFFSIGIKK